MDINKFYNLVDHHINKGGGSLFDKFKLDNTDLINAVSNSDATAVADSLKAWVNPNKPDGLERYALPIAIDNNNKLIVGMLLYYKANPNVQGKDGESALYKATFWENETIVRLLLDKGATPNFPNKNGETAVQLAKDKNFNNIHALLTNDKAHLKKMQVEKDRATHIALKEKAHKAKATKLNDSMQLKNVKHDAHPEFEEIDSKTDIDNIESKYKDLGGPVQALIAAIKSEDSRAVKHFTAKAENINKTIDGESPLQLAILGGKERLALFLMDMGADLFTQDEDANYTLLNNSIQNQFYDLISEALSKRENVSAVLNHKDQSFSPQFLAYKDPRMMDILLQHGADPFYGGKDGMSPIFKAIEKGSIAILPVLSKREIDFSRKINDKSLINWAIGLNRADWVRGLIAEKALENESDHAISELIKEAQLTKNDEIVGILEQYVI